jgi:spermidine synthase
MVPQLHVPMLLRAALMLTPAAAAVLIRTRTRPVTLLYAALAIACSVQAYGRNENHRSFFGVAHLKDTTLAGYGPLRMLTHGTTLHGVQFLSSAYRCRTTTYYARQTMIGRVFAGEQAAKPALNIGAVGLGAGTVAAYVRPADRMRFYEIDPLMGKLAFDPKRFSFISGCAQGPVDLVLGDARLELTKAPPATYDLLLVDAFSSDAVPTHLMTVEGVKSYLRVLRPDGVAVMHLSNRNMDLRGPAAAAAKAAGAYSLAGTYWNRETSSVVASSQYVLLLARSPEALDRYRGKPGWSEPQPDRRPWTDDYTNVWGAVVAQARQTIEGYLD